MSLAGDLFTDYTIKVTGMIGDASAAGVIPDSANSVSTEFNLRIKNPCLDREYVKIIPNDLHYK